MISDTAARDAYQHRLGWRANAHLRRRAGASPPRPACCDLHDHHCEWPSELCCFNCTEISHKGLFPHADGTPCVLDQQPEPSDV